MRQQNVVNVPRGVDAVAAAGALSPGGGHKRCWPPALCALLLLFAVSLLGSKAIAIEVAAQTLSTDTTWTADAGPYQVTGNVTVANGTTLTIAPGTEIQFAANATLNVQGALDAQGTATAPIHFEPLAGESQPWGGITLASYTTESVIRYANISGAYTCVELSGGAVHQIRQSTITGCASNGIRISEGSPRIENNLIVENAGSGIYAYSGVDGPIIRRNSIDHNGAYGVYLYSADADTELYDNLITRNETGLYLSVAAILRGYNNVWGNAPDYVSASAAGTDLSSDPGYVDANLGNRQLLADSPSKTAAEDGGELGAYGAGGSPPDYIPARSTAPTTAGTLTQHEYWSGEVTLTDNVRVNWPWTLEIAPGTVVRAPATVGLTINSSAKIIGAADQPIRLQQAGDAEGTWGGVDFGSASVSGVVRHAWISGADRCIDIADSVHVIVDNVLVGCAQAGIYIADGGPIIEHNLIVENGDYGIYASSYARPSIRHNTIDRNGAYGLYFTTSNAAGTVVENNLITRNGGYGWYQGSSVTCGHNNVWGNADDYYSAGTAPDSHIASDPLYLGPFFGDRRLLDGSPSLTAGTDGDELGAYGAGGSPPDYDPTLAVTAPTTAGALTGDERWSGEVVLTDSVSVDWPWRLEIDPGTVVRGPAGAEIQIKSLAEIVGTEENPVVLDGIGLDFAAGAGGSLVRHTLISGAHRCIEIADSVHVIVDNVLVGCAQAGIYIADGGPIIEHNLIVENGDYGIYASSYARPSIRHNTIDRNGAYGLYFTTSNAAGTVVENNLITRNGGYGWYQGSSVTCGHNNVWGNADDYYSAGTAPDSHIASDPLYLGPFFGDRRLLDGSPSLTAGTDGDELGAYGAGGSPPDYDPTLAVTAPTTAGALTGDERWSGEVVLTDSVSVDWPWRLEIDPGTVVRGPAGAEIQIKSLAEIVGTEENPVVLDGIGLDFAAGAGGSLVRHTLISGAHRCIEIADSVHVIVDNVLAGCAQAGIYIADGGPIIEHNFIVENGDYGIYAGRYARPSIRYNTIDRNGEYGLFFNGSNGAGTIVENNLITRNGRYGWYYGTNVTRGHNNVWGNGDAYANAGTIPESHIASDPLYLEPFFGDRRLLEGSLSLSAGTDGGELGAYGAGGSPPDYDPQIEATTPTTAGALTGHERWSGEVVLTDTVSVDWPWRLELAPGTVVRGPAGAEIQIKSLAEIVGTEDNPVVLDGVGLDFAAGAGGSLVRHAWIGGADRCIDIADGVHVIVDNVITGCGRYGVVIGGGRPVLENNLIVENGAAGVYVSSNSARPSIRYNTVDRNGNAGLFFNGANGAESLVENNLITRNGGRGWYYGTNVTRGHNNVWGNGDAYANAGTIPESHIASDPLYLEPFFGDRRLLEGSPSLSAGTDGGELGAYGAGGSPPDHDPQIEATTPTTAGALTGHERWSGEVVLTDTVSVDWPWRLEIAPGTVVRGAADAEIQIKSLAEIAGTEDNPVVLDGVGLDFAAGAGGSLVRHAWIGGADRCIDIADGVHVIVDNVITGCGRYGVVIGGGRPVLENNLIVENGAAGVYVSSNSARPSIRYNTVDRNGNAGLFFNGANGAESLVENNLITRNGGRGWYYGTNVTRGHNNVWGNGDAYANAGTIPESHIASDPLYLEPFFGDRRLLEGSPSLSAGTDGGELGAYGAGGSPPDHDPQIEATTPTTAGALTGHERWSGEVALTDTVTVDWPWRLELAPGTVVRGPAGAEIQIKSLAEIVGTEENPVVLDGVGLDFAAGAAGSLVHHAWISGADRCIDIADGVHVIVDNVITGCGRYGVVIGGGRPVLENNLIVENGAAGVYVSSNSARPSIRYNTVDRNGNAGLFFNGANGAESLVENNLITRNGGYGWYYGTNITRGHNNVWGNATDYSSAGTIPESHIASDPLYLDPDNADWRLAAESPSKTAAANGGEIGRYGGVFLAAWPTLDPVTSPVAATEQVLTGTKAAGTGVGINGSLLVPVDETTLWSATLPLAEGLNSIAIYGIDALGQRSDVIRASIRRDTLPPAIVASTPADGAITNALFDQIRITLSDASEIDYTDAIDGARVSGNKYGLIRGAWQQQGSTLVFTADEAFSPDAYQVSLPLADLPLGNSAEASIAFRIDDIGGATPSAPEITELLYDGAPLADAAVLTQSADIAVRVEDLNGISRVELFIDGARLGTDTSRDPYYRFALALPDLADGAHRIELLAFDSLGNRAATARDVTVALAAPAAPALTTPATDLLTNRTEIAVSGTAAYGSEVVLLRNGSAIGDPLPLDWRNRFSGTLPLDEGANQLQVIARNRGGDSAPSAVVTITVDPSVPPAPTGLIAETRDSGVIRLDWQGPGDLDIAGYDVYRAAEPFDGTAAATRITTQPITVERLDDAPGSDGRFYYRVVTVNRAGTQSEPSHQAQADADATPPRATAILYRTLGAHDPDSGRFGVGAVEVQVEVSESLAEAPFLSLTPDLIPEQGEPMPVALRRIAETTYSGQIEIAAETPSGLRTAVFSARDRAGNRGTAVEAGETLLIDTEGPRVTDLTITPADPIRNAPAPVTVDVSLSLSSDLAPDTTPDLTWRIDGDGQATDPAPIDLIEAEPRVWTGSLTLPATAGAAAPAALVLEPSATDDLGNPSAPLAGGNRFQVYQGELPPLEVPAGLAAEALPGGAVQLTWQPVDGAADYQLYRTAPGEADLLPLARSAGATELTDTTETDGLHRYAVASVRSANGQEGLSAPSAVVEALADGTPPEPPTGLTASLTAAGIQLGWTATAEAPAPAYRLYRAADAILDTAGIEPVLADLAAPEALDPRPAVAEPFYAVTAVDAAGNESAPTASVHLNVSLLPVAELTVTQQDSDAPVLRWTAPHAEVAGYRVHVLDGEAALPLHAGELTETELVDTGYTGEPRRYAVATVDAAGVEGPRVEVLLPALDALTLAPAIRRGEMNRLDVTVQNLGDAPIPALTLTAELPGADATQRRESPSLALGPLESRTLSLVLGGAADLPDLADLTLTLTAPTDTGGTARIIRTEAVEIGNGALAGDLLAAELTRGGTGQVRIRLTNSGSAEVQIVTALGHGAADSDEVRVLLTDTDGNLLATAPLRQGFGEQIQIGPDGRAIAGIAPGATFVSAPMALAVPSAIPDDVELLLVIDRLHHGLPTTVDAAPTPPPISIEGLTARRPLRLIDTAYRGDITAVTPEASLGGEPIRITGRAVERGTGYLLTHVPLDLVITVDGFERVFEVVTDGAGQFSHDFEPLPGEFGSYQVAAVHPDLSERPIQARFSIGQVVLSPQTYRLGAIRSQASEVPIRIETSPGAGLAGVRLHFDAADQPLGALPDGVSVSLPEAVDLGGGDSVQLAIGVTADEDAADTGTLILGLRSSDLGDRDLGTLRIDYSLTAARPALVFSPSYLETGVARDQSATETLRLENQGLATLAGVTLTLIDAQGDPAPSWLFLSSSAEPGDLSVGDAVDVGITAAPSSAVAEGDYEYRLRIDSGNADPVEINLYVAVSDAGVGAVRFHVADIYTETLDGDGTPIPGLAGASIRLQNEQVLSIDETLTTSANGEALFADLPAGRYKFRATAPNHQPVVGRLRVKPGVTLGQDIFLDYDLITVEWSVTEIPLQDRYEITLRTEYETDVPAPVVVMEPASVNLPADMEPGDVFHGQFTLTNYGLIRAEAMQLDIDSDAEYRVEVLGAVPAMLEPKQRVTVAYRVVLMDTGVNAEDASGGAESGCYSKRIRVGVTYEYRCVNGEWRWVAVPHYIWRVFGDCPSGPGVGGGSAGAGGGGGGGGGGGCCGGGSAASGRGGRGGSSTPSKPADRPKPEPIAPNYCVPEAPPEEPPLCPDDDQQVPAGSWVHAVIREYQDRMTDLTVKVPGGEAAISRRFYGDDWHWDHERTRLRLFRDLDSGLVREIERANVSYAPVVFGSDDVFRNDTYRIIREPDGFRWEDAGGNWERYDSQGRPVARGRDARTIVQLAYPDADATRPSALLDADGNSVFSFEYQGDLLSAVSDAHGRRVEYGYTGSRLTRVTDANGGIQGYSYDAKGRMTAKTDAEDRRISIGYTSTGEVASVLRADGTGTRFEYGWDDAAEERYARIQTSSGKETEVWYNADGDVLRTALNARPMRTVDEERRVRISTDEKGNVTRTTLDQWDKPLRVVYPDGSEVSYAYDNRFHKVRRQVDRRGIVTEYSYDARGNLTRRVEAVGLPEERATRYVYDAADQLLEQVQEADADTAEARTAFTYDTVGNLATITDPEGHVTRMLEHDPMGNPLRIQDARGETWTFTYDALGRLLGTTDPEDNTTSFEYDAVGNRTARIDAAGNRFEYAYDHRDQLVRSIDPLGAVSSIQYNSDGLPTLVTVPEGRETRNEYDNEGRLLRTIVGPLDYGIVTEYHYDDTGPSYARSDKPVQIDYPTYSQRLYYDRMQRLVRETDVLDADTEHSRSREYDAAGNLVAETDEEDRVTRYVYDGLGRMIEKIDAAGYSTLYAYDDRDNMIALTDANGGVWRFEYDRNNRVVAEILPLGQTTRYEYDALGNRTAILDAKGQRIEYHYSPAGRMVQERHFATGDHSNPVKVIDYFYDALGRLTGYDDATTSAVYTYDANGRKLTETVDYGPFELGHSYSYYLNGLKASFTDPEGETTRYDYDEANRLSAIELDDGQRITYTEYEWNRPGLTNYPSGLRTHYDYDSLQRIDRIQGQDSNGTVLLDYRYTRSPAGNIRTKDTALGRYTYEYDPIGRLKGATHPALRNEAYTYDPVGNRLTSEDGVKVWMYDENNRLIGNEELRLEFDENGNVTEYQETGEERMLLYYDVQNRLMSVEVSASGDPIEFLYDPFGMRLSKAGGSTRVYFSYANEVLAGEYDTESNVIRKYGMRPGHARDREPLFFKVGQSWLWFENDRIGYPAAMRDAGGSKVWAAHYGSFGDSIVYVSLQSNSIRFPGHYFDDDLGWVYNGARYYAPDTGRYLTRDPADSAYGSNEYVYGNSNPLSYIDVDGREPSAADTLNLPGVPQIPGLPTAFPAAGVALDDPQGFAEGLHDIQKHRKGKDCECLEGEAYLMCMADVYDSLLP